MNHEHDMDSTQQIKINKKQVTKNNVLYNS